jgi:hypothetical protein
MLDVSRLRPGSLVPGRGLMLPGVPLARSFLAYARCLQAVALVLVSFLAYG